MRKVLLAILLSSVPALADGNGVDIIPFTTPGGQIEGVVSIDSEGNASVTGTIQGVPFTCLGKAARDSQGRWVWDCLLSDYDTLVRQKTWVPVKMTFWGTKDDAMDGDDSDDFSGEITVHSQHGVGKGTVKVTS